MKAPENKKEKKAGILGLLSRFFGGSSGAAGGSSIGAASSGFGAFLTSKAGIVGMVLGGATIAAGVGVIYNFMGPSSKPVYSPGLFENQYYEAEAEKAAAERVAETASPASAESASLDYFKQEAQKNNLFSDGSAEESASADDELASASAEGDVVPGEGGADGAAGNIPRLQKAAGFSSGGKGSRTNIPRMSSMGGLSGGIGAKFQKIYRPPLNTGKSSSMKGALASRLKKSSKYKIPIGKRSGAYGQAKFAKKVSKGASISGSETDVKSTAVKAFEGETTGEGDVAAMPSGGAGLGGAGLSDGSNLKSSDPSLNANNSTPPKLEDPTPDDVSPWKKYEDMALYGLLASVALILITKILANVGKTNPFALKAAVICAYAAIAAAAVVIFAGVMMMSKYGQKWMGIMYVMMGAALVWQAYQALSGVGKAMSAEGMKAKFADTFWSKITPGFGG